MEYMKPLDNCMWNILKSVTGTTREEPKSFTFMKYCDGREVLRCPEGPAIKDKTHLSKKDI